MNFYIKRLIIWFGEADKPRILTFKKDKVNVITGNSSTGKSNIIGIIDYCLLSAKSNIVEPIVNEFTSWYGLEFSINGKVFSIARKRPELETASSDVLFLEKGFEDESMPSSTNMQIEAARKYMNSLLGYSNDLRFYQFRANMVFNIITEDIITSPHFYLNFPFVERDNYNNIDWHSILEMAITPNITELLRINKEITLLVEKNRKVDSNNKKYAKTVEIINRCVELLSQHKLVPEALKLQSLSMQLSYIREYINEIKSTINSMDNDIRTKLNSLRTSLFKKSLQYSEVKNAIEQYKQYRIRLEEYNDSLRPLELLRKKAEDNSKSIWTNYIIESLNISFQKIKGQLSTYVINDNKESVILKQLKKECEDLTQQILSLEKIDKKKTLDAESFRAVGIVEEILKENDKRLEKDCNLTFISNESDIKQIEGLNEKKEEFERSNYDKWNKLNECFQSYFNQCNSIDQYDGAKTKLDKDLITLKLRGKGEGYEYSVVGSQSNYMFMHLFFFLGLHQYIIDNISDSNVFQYLFIDQPSIPYYVGTNDLKSTDRGKLEDAFNLINIFMKHIIEDLKGHFQIILIEHAPQDYWKDKLDYFTTCEIFQDGKALIPQDIINKYKETHD